MGAENAMNANRCTLFFNILMVSVVLSSAKEVWVTPVGTDHSGTGTAASPYVCSSQSSFDSLMNGSTIPTYSIIHLMAGTFNTMGNVPLRAGWKFRGAGIDVTTIKMMTLTKPSRLGYNVHVLGRPPNTYRNDDVEVSDMTLDCNLQNQTVSRAIGAVWLQGANTKISRVKAINWGSEQADIECDILGIGATQYLPYSIETNCLIEDCIVEQPAQVTHLQGSDGFTIGGSPVDQSAICGNGWVCGAEIRNCKIYDVGIGSFGNPNYMNGMAIGNGVFGGKMDENMFVNFSGTSVFSSCGSLVNCSIENNKFLDVGAGIGFAGSDHCPNNTNSLKENISISNNIITVQSGGNGIFICGIFGNIITNVTVANNTVRAATGAGSFTGLTVYSINGLTVQDNILDANGGASFTIGSGVTLSQIYNNQNLAGQNIHIFKKPGK